MPIKEEKEMNISICLVAEISDKEINSTMVIAFFVLLLPLFIWFFKYVWLHPRHSIDKVKRNLTRAEELKTRLINSEQLLTDLQLQNLVKYNIRSKGITIKWTDDITGNGHELNLLVNGTDETSKALKELAKVSRRETEKELFKVIYKLPKRHSKSDIESLITIHNIE